MPVTFGYWKLRGLGQSIRLIMQYAGIDYNERSYEFGPAPDFARCDWLNDKFTLGMDFPNLPYYFDGKYKITQSHAILKHIGRKHHLDGKSECEKVRIDMAEHEAADLRDAWIQLVYKSSFCPKTKESYRVETLRPKMENFNKFLGDHKWFAGEHLTYVDFLLYELFDIHRTLFPCCMTHMDNIQKFMIRFESLEPIRRFMNSCDFMKAPINGPMAKFGGQ